jgi:hypothetical protein
MATTDESDALSRGKKVIALIAGEVLVRRGT